ncbi:putative secreted protein (Por secretion system target) [Kordia periserrulae]|uniref:Putative secreted protein (Por secretion system target) n=1 Tax=Kordia periserrulae TaxID=701523 RepID=A0A2T6BZX4_9FLAO|nr:T9SS type A sorting domain-containing protein [Kordia periserrulae]PTX61624.1 putative secreted protein (Por secretion system target) [Kordia periserrulae]
MMINTIKIKFFIGLLLLLFSNEIYAQLLVQDDAYIFVNDRVLFVGDDVNLQSTDAKIYLRDNSQLIQGDGTTGNAGTGQLSVYQSGTTHEYAYNYWCSPVGNNSAALGNENFRINLIDDATGLTTSSDALFTSYNGSSSPLTIASYWIYTFENATEYSEWFYRGNTGTIAPGLGFTMKGTSGSGNNQLYDFRGKPNNGTISNSVTAEEWTLVGNPYPSAMDALDYIHDTDNAAAITGTLYYWEQDLSVLSHFVADYVGGYATYTINAAGTLETFIPATFDTYNSDGSLNTVGSNSTSGKRARRYIPIGQGFMVEGSSSTTGIVQTKNSHREYYKQTGADSEFFRMSNQDDVGFIENDSATEDNATTTNSVLNPYGVVPEAYKRFRLNVDFNDVYTRQLVQTFHGTEATTGFDYGLESKSPSTIAKDAYWLIENEPYVAQALPFASNMTIPLHIQLDDDSVLRIRIFDIQNFDANQSIYLLDNEANTYTDLKVLPFEITLPQGEYHDRFQIVFNQATLLSTDDLILTDVQITQDNLNHKIYIHNPERYNLKEIALYDILGKKIKLQQFSDAKNLYELDTNTLTDGVYIIHILASDYRKVSKKIIIKK